MKRKLLFLPRSQKFKSVDYCAVISLLSKSSRCRANMKSIGFLVILNGLQDFNNLRWLTLERRDIFWHQSRKSVQSSHWPLIKKRACLQQAINLTNSASWNGSKATIIRASLDIATQKEMVTLVLRTTKMDKGVANCRLFWQGLVLHAVFC